MHNLTSSENQLQSVIRLIYSQLSEESPNISLEINEILSFVLQVDRNQIVTLSPTTQISSEQVHLINSIIAQRKGGKPLERITKRVEFYGLTFKVCPNVLIPRPETEELVSILLDSLELYDGDRKVLEIGGGTGVISLSTILNLKSTDHSNDFHICDVSDDAVSCINSNTTSLVDDTQKIQGIRVSKWDVFSEVPEYLNHISHIVSNPPYLTKDEIRNLNQSVEKHDPKLALYGGEDGLDFYRRILEVASHLNYPEVFLEVSPTIYQQVNNIFSKNYKVEVKKDLFERERFVIASRA